LDYPIKGIDCISDLFQRVIQDSGSGFTAGYVYTNSEQQQPNDGSKSAAVRLGCITAENWDKHDDVHILLMLQCLRSEEMQWQYYESEPQ
jgi:hypothetical protein